MWKCHAVLLHSDQFKLMFVTKAALNVCLKNKAKPNTVHYSLFV